MLVAEVDPCIAVYVSVMILMINGCYECYGLDF